MKDVRILKVTAATILALIMVFSSIGCAGKSSTNNVTTGSTTATTQVASEAVSEKDPYEKYESAITLTTVYRDSNRTYPQGQSWDNNFWTQAFEEKLGIKFDYLWSASANEFDTKMNMAIATDELPDIMAINYDQFYRMAKAGKLADLTEAYNTYAADEIKYAIDGFGGIGKEMVTVDGKMYGLGRYIKPEATRIFSYRNDWLKNLGLSAPKTLDDVINFMYAATKGDPNKDGTKVYGLPIHKGIFGSLSLEGFFNMYNARPQVWVEKNGKLEHGAVQPEMKAALQQLHQMFKDGVINPEFGLVDEWGRLGDEYVANMYGCGFVPNWFTDWKGGDIATNTNGNGTWSFVPLPSVDGGIAKSDYTASQGVIVCMLKTAKNPEAAIKIANLQLKLLYEEPGKYHTYVENGNNIPTHFFQFAYDLILDAAYKPEDDLLLIAKAIEAKDPSKLNELKKVNYERSIKYLDGDLSAYGIYGVVGPGGSYEAFDELNKNGHMHVNQYYGPNTDTMNSRMSGLKSKLEETITRVIIEGNVDAEFQAWVNFWNSQGGEEITREVNEWYTSKK